MKRHVYRFLISSEITLSVSTSTEFLRTTSSPYKEDVSVSGLPVSLVFRCLVSQRSCLLIPFLPDKVLSMPVDLSWLGIPLVHLLSFSVLKLLPRPVYSFVRRL